MTLKKIPILLTEVVKALTETRDICVRAGHDSFSRTTLTIDDDGEWEFNPGCGSLVEPHGHDEGGYRSYTLPIVVGSFTDKTVKRIAREWAIGEYKEEFKFPPMVEILIEAEETD